MSYTIRSPYRTPRGDARLDLTDLYAFPKPGDLGRSILIMNVHPSVGLKSAGTHYFRALRTRGLDYPELKIDTDGDAVANISYEVRIASTEGGGGRPRRCALWRAHRPHRELGASGKVIVEGVPVSTGHEAHVTQGR